MTLEELQGKLGYVFSNPRLLAEALTHSSHRNEHGGEDNERLEFLGDAVLDLAVTELLLESWPDAAEGQLSKLRTRLVNTEALVGVATGLGLGDLLRLGRGEEATGGRQKPRNLEGAAEAVLGAVFRDGGYARAAELARRWAQSRIELIDRREQGVLGWNDPKSALQEVVQRGGRPAPTYHEQADRREGPDHDRRFTVEVRVAGVVLGYGQGRTKREAERNAAACALRDLGRSP